MPRSFTILFLGCARRQLDCERIRSYFAANGLQWVEDPERADVIVVSSCGLSKEFEDRCLDFLRRALRCRGEVVLYGCLPSMNPERVDGVFDGKIVNTRTIDKFDAEFPGLPVPMREIPDANRAFAPAPGSSVGALKRRLKRFDLYHPVRLAHVIWRGIGPIAAELHKTLPWLVPAGLVSPALPFAIDFNNELFTLRIAEGCRGKCSYCTIRRAIGGLESKPLDDLLVELRSGLREGARRINVISSDTGSWGTDRGETLPELLRAVLAEDENLVIQFIQDLHPSWICRYGPELEELVATGRIRSILTAVQSGSERVLSLMRRPTDLALFRRTLKALRRASPRLRLRTQIIVGFPSETEEDLRETMALVRACRFDEVDVFTYFETPSMASAKIQPKVTGDASAARAKLLAGAVSRGVVLHTEIAV